VKDFKVHARKSLHCYEWTVKGNSVECPLKKRTIEKISNILGNFYPPHSVHRNKNDQGHSNKVLDRNEEYVIGN
jgi:hypothetical protein